MTHAPLPADLSLWPFFVLQWSRAVETAILAAPSHPDSTFDLGDYLPIVSRTLQLRGLSKLFADRAVDAAREFGAVQAIPDEERIINLLPRRVTEDPIARMLAHADQLRGGYAHL